jgi:hypothetical protein
MKDNFILLGFLTVVLLAIIAAAVMVILHHDEPRPPALETLEYRVEWREPQTMNGQIPPFEI